MNTDVNQKPNIIFIFADDWGWGDLGLHGHPVIKTPVLDKFASEGIDFQDFYVNNPVCSPSRTAAMTGHYPARYGVHQHFAGHDENAKRGMPDWLDTNAVTLPSLLKKAGYRTAHYGKWHLTSRSIPDAPTPLEYGLDDAAVFNGTGKQVWDELSMPNEAKEYNSAYLTVGAVEQTLKFIDENKNYPFYINLWIHETHNKVEATPLQKKVYEDEPSVKEPELTYYAAVTKADTQIGRVLDKIKALGLDDNTLIIFSSDNGPEVPSEDPGQGTYYSRGSTGGLKGRKRSLFDGGVRTPFLVRWPGRIPAGVVNRSTTITAVDLLPTLCAATGALIPESYRSDGENMLPALLGNEVKRKRPIFWEWRGNEGNYNWPRLGVRDGDWKLVIDYYKKRAELYHKDDWEQENDMHHAMPDIVERLTDMVFKWKGTLLG